jgi:hypothetical protein
MGWDLLLGEEARISEMKQRICRMETFLDPIHGSLCTDPSTLGIMAEERPMWGQEVPWEGSGAMRIVSLDNSAFPVASDRLNLP